MLTSEITQEKKVLPHHIAIIMDGNGRWAHRQKISTISGHQAGAKALRRVIVHVSTLKIPYLTVFAFSSENWRRPMLWIEQLMGLLTYYLKHEVEQLIANNVKVKIVGDRHRLPHEITCLIEQLEQATANNTGLTLIIAISYSGRQDITQAAKTIAKKAMAGQLSIDNINEETLATHLETAAFPDPDMLIRTSGEFRISNFLLWQLAYAEFIFVDKLWPDFDTDDLDAAIVSYQSRERRYGAIIGQ